MTSTNGLLSKTTDLNMPHHYFRGRKKILACSFFYFVLRTCSQLFLLYRVILHAQIFREWNCFIRSGNLRNWQRFRILFLFPSKNSADFKCLEIGRIQNKCTINKYKLDNIIFGRRFFFIYTIYFNIFYFHLLTLMTNS